MNSEYSMPLYLQLKENIKTKIDNGEFKKGAKIPSEREMVKIYGINRMTIRKTLKLLIDEGYLISVQGRGTFVTLSNNKIELGMSCSTRLSSDIRIGGMNPRKDVISMKLMELPIQIKGRFGQEKSCYEIKRLLYANEEPYALQITYIPFKDFADADRFDFRKESLYDYMEMKGEMPIKIESFLHIEEADSETSKYLNINDKNYVFVFEYRGYIQDERLVELTISYNRPDFTSYKYVSVR